MDYGIETVTCNVSSWSIYQIVFLRVTTENFDHGHTQLHLFFFFFFVSLSLALRTVLTEANSQVLLPSRMSVPLPSLPQSALAPDGSKST